jgi:hypothetical protein
MKYLIGILLVTLTILYTFQFTNSKSRQGGESSKERSWWQPITDNGLYNKEPTMSQQSRAGMPGIDNASSNYKAFLQLVRRNVLFIDLRRGGTSIATCQHCLAIDNDHIIINEHALRSRSGDPFDEIVIYRRNVGIRQQIGYYRINHLHSVLIHPDVRLFHIPQPLQCKDIKLYFHRQDWTALTGGVRLGYSNWRSYENPTKENPIMEVETHSDYGAIKVVNNETYWVFSKCLGKTDFGDCGSPWVSKSATGAVIFGIHGGALGADPFFSDNRDRFACRVTYEDLLKGLAQVKPFGLVTQNCNDIQPESLFYDTQGNSSYNLSMVEPIHHKAQAFWIDHTSEGEDRFCGIPHYTLQKVIQNHSTEFGFFASLNYWLERGVKIDKYPPSYAYNKETDSINYVSQTIPRSLTKSSYYLGITEIHEMARTVNVKLLDICGKHYVECVLKRLPDGWEKEIKKYTTFEAVYGILGVQYVDAMNFSTSFGFPVNKKKSFCLGFNDSKPMEIPDWLRNRIDFLEDQYSKGSRCNPVFTSHLKDEFVSEKKLKAQRLRVFMGSPCDFTIVSRKYLLSFVRLMQLYRFAFECAVAIRAQSLDWSDLYDYLTWNGRITKFIAGDYKFFDKAMHFYVLAVASSVVISIIRASGQFSESDINICKLILLDIINCVVNYDGSIMELFGTNPSGHALTVILNCIVGSIYVRYAFFIKFGKLDLFEEQIRLITYGDDNGIGVDDSCSFTFMDMKTGIAELSTYTTADKKDVGPDHEPIDKISFLQRGFLENEFLSKIFGRRVFTAPLNEASIHKMLIGGRKTLPDMACISTGLKTAIREYAFHSECKYLEWSTKIADCAKHFYLSDYVPRSQQDWLLRWFRDDICREIDKNLRLELSNNYLNAANEALKELDTSGESFINLNEKIVREMGWSDSYLDVANETLKGLDLSGKGFSLNPSEEVVRETGLSTWVVQPFKKPANFLHYDEAPAGEVSMPATTAMECISDDHIGDLASFLTRPIKIASFDWVEGTSIRKTYYPWELYLGNGSISDKIKNFSKFRANLKITILVNSNPFKYSGLICAYKPLVSGLVAGTNVGDVSLGEYRDFSGGCIDTHVYRGLGDPQALNAQLMQRQHVVIYPQETTKVEMILPFIWNLDYLPMLTASTWNFRRQMGKLDFSSIADLASCADPTINPVTIDIFAECVNPVLSGPSLQREADEYDSSKPISSTASAISNAAGQLSKLPVIGPWATTVSIFSGLVGSVASWFGFSNPNNLQSSIRVKQIRASGWANPQEMVPMVKLALDPKNELSVDPAVLGFPRKDELNIEYLCNKPFYTGLVAWNDDDAPGQILMTGVVAPIYGVFENFTPVDSEVAIAAGAKVATLAPATWVAQNFQFSRFDMRLRFKFICTKFHRGRVRFIYDPSDTINNFTEGKIFSRIIDLNVDNDVTIDIPYMAYTPRVEHPRITLNDFTNVQSGYDRYFNLRLPLVTTSGRNVSNRTVAGVWRLEVMTDLSSPKDAGCYIECHTSFHNVDFSSPVSPITSDVDLTPRAPGWSYSAPLRIMRESQEYDTAPGAKAYDKVGEANNEINHLCLLTGGESVKSVRQLLHRWNYADTMVSSTILKTVQSGVVSVFKKRHPTHHGTNAVSTDLFDNTNPYLYHLGGQTNINYFSPAFAAWRGGINWRFDVDFRDCETLAINNQWIGNLVEVRNCALSRKVSCQKLAGGVESESITVTADNNPISGANLRTFKERVRNTLIQPLLYGAEVSSELSDGVMQQIEGTLPDYQPYRANPCNIYRLGASGSADQFVGGGYLNSDFARRDFVTLSGAFKRKGNNIETTGQNPENCFCVVKSYCCSAPDFTLMGFLNVPSMYYYTDLADPVSV